MNGFLSSFSGVELLQLIPILFGGLIAAAIVVLLMGALGRPRMEIDTRGTRRPAPSDVERLFSPLASRLLRRRAGGRARLARELTWTRSRFSPELFTVIPVVAAPAAALIMFGVGVFEGMDTTMTAIICVAAALGGWFYVPSRHNAAMRRRRAAAHEDAVVFMGQYARTAMTSPDMPTIFAEMNRYVIEERHRFAARQLANPRRRYGVQPYDSAIWQGLVDMMARSSQGLVRDGATLEDPDILQQFVVFCDDPDMTTFLVHLRTASIQHRRLDPGQLDAEVRELRAARIDEARASWARLVNEATIYLVVFNLPILFGVILGPFLSPYIPGLLGGG
jgi:hypothetical protein